MEVVALLAGCALGAFGLGAWQRVRKWRRAMVAWFEGEEGFEAREGEL